MKRDVSSAVCDFFEVKPDNRICQAIADFTIAPVNLGDFTLQRILGSGSFSVVTLVIHRDSLVKYALKMMNKNSPIVKRRVPHSQFLIRIILVIDLIIYLLESFL